MLVLSLKVGSRFMFGVAFLIWMASTVLLSQNPSALLWTVTPSQLMQWLVFWTWTAIPFLGSPRFTACLCSSFTEYTTSPMAISIVEDDTSSPMADSVLEDGARSPVQPENSWETAWCCLFVLRSYARIPPPLMWSDLSIISFSGSPFWYNLEVPVALNVYWPLATLVAYINKYTWRPWMTKLCASKKNYILWRVSLSIVHSPISMRIYDCMRWMKANDVAVIALCAKHWSCLWGTRYSQQHS